MREPRMDNLGMNPVKLLSESLVALELSIQSPDR
jgi:hypothetical protein